MPADLGIYDPGRYVAGVPNDLLAGMRPQLLSSATATSCATWSPTCRSRRFRRFEGAELTGPPRRLRSNLTNSCKSIPVRLTPRAG